MKIAPGIVVTLAYDITTESGEIVESSDISGPITFMHGKGALIPGLDKRLEGLEAGDDKQFDIPPEEAFGTEESAPSKLIPKAEFPASVPLKAGSAFEADMPGGQTIRLVLKEVRDDEVEVKMVHPLAGQSVSMSVSIKSVRPATAAEQEAGRAIVRPPAPPPK